ncbi:MAG: excinuclease ABC subunit UvrB [Clostridia bacterium]|nr:excinuclease ABC subunit UvrB [Clostridia bacterium]
MAFELHSNYSLCGDQPRAVESIVNGINSGLKEQVLQGVTGSGKTFTMANIIKQTNKPTLVLAHNKTLAGQLCNEFREFFPNNRVEYFVSYYDYYQPEAYIVKSDTYIEKDASINEEIDRLRHSATSSLLETDNVIVVASVSCIYALGAPQEYYNMHISIRKGENYNIKEIIKRLLEIQYERNDIEFKRSTFRVKGDTLDIIPSNYNERGVRIEFFDTTVERIYEFDVLSNKVVLELKHIAIFPATHYAVKSDSLKMALKEIENDRDMEVQRFLDKGKLIEAQRLKERVSYDLEMMREIGYCSGIENYSRYFDGRKPGDAPFTLLDYFKKDFLLFVDESHITLSQVRGMFNGDHQRKGSLIDYGFRLNSAYDNRPLNFEEFNSRINQVVYVSATPAPYELSRAENVAVQLIRPTGLLDPRVEVRPSKFQVDELIEEINIVVEKQGRVLVTTLTKKMAESLTEYLNNYKIKVRYMHSDIDALERLDIINGLRNGSFDVLVGINLLREGLDLPEVMLVAILDADKEGFLRSETSLIQTIGRAARNSESKVIMFADTITQSMKRAMDITSERRKIQQKYNEEHGIVPKTIIKKVASSFAISNIFKKNKEKGDEKITRKDILQEIERLQALLNTSVRSLDFESAIKLRDRIAELKLMLNT